MATEVAYYTYIYAKVERKHYQQVTSNSRSAILFGRFSASIMAQLFIEFGVMNAAELNYISFGSECTCMLSGGSVSLSVSHLIREIRRLVA